MKIPFFAWNLPLPGARDVSQILRNTGVSKVDALLVEDLQEITGNSLEVDLEDREEAVLNNFLNSEELPQVNNVIRALPILDQLKNGPNLTLDDSGNETPFIPPVYCLH